jgi:hypothetical protein
MSRNPAGKGSIRALFRGVVIAGARIYLTLALIQFLLGLLFGAGLVLLGFDLAGIEALLRNLAERFTAAG